MATATSTEYLEIDGLPLSTAAWSTEDISSLLDGPAVRGQDLVNPSRIGEIARRRTLAARTVVIPLVINGVYNSDGGEHTDPRTGLLANLDELKAKLLPAFLTTAGTKTLRWVRPAGVRTAEVHVNPAFQLTAVGPTAARVVIEITIPGGVLRDETETDLQIEILASETTKTATVTVPGNVEVQDVRIEHTAAVANPNSNSFKITNLTYGPDVYLEYPVAVTNPLTFYTGEYRAIRGTSTSISGFVVNAGSPLWLPLLPGDNQIKVDIPGNAELTYTTLVVRGAWA